MNPIAYSTNSKIRMTDIKYSDRFKLNLNMYDRFVPVKVLERVVVDTYVKTTCYYNGYVLVHRRGKGVMTSVKVMKNNEFFL